jgi:CRISPR-associated endonuclease Csn1
MIDTRTERVLGLDIGVSSVGWALIEREVNGNGRIVALGSRVFPAGVDLGKGGEEALHRGNEKSLAAGRRNSRQLRRQLMRRARRVRSTARLLVKAGLLPDLGTTSEERREALAQLDALLTKRYPVARSTPDPGLPYRLRALALSEALPAHALGRALLHLAQRRGFKSNRKLRESKDDGVVKQGISALEQSIVDAGKRTLGEYLATVDPHQERIRNRYTSRAQYLREFEEIVAAQRLHHPELLRAEFVRKLRHRIFFQRPLRSSRHLVGKCSVEVDPPRRRCAMALPTAQEFRLLQKLNDLRAITTDGEIRELSPEERTIILTEARRHSKTKFTTIRKRLKGSGIKEFNLERGGEEHLRGLDSLPRIREAAPELTKSLEASGSLREFDELVELLRSSDDLGVSARLVQRRFECSAEEAEALAATSFEDGYAAFSKRALYRLLPELHNGVPLQTALKKLYGVVTTFDPLPKLPPLEKLFGRLPAPAVVRSLTELRKVVNAIVQRYGLPDKMVVELAGDLKRPKKERERIALNNARRRKMREGAEAAITRLAGIDLGHPTKADIEKMLLLEECNHTCPYTGRTISAHDLFGPHPTVDVEHIVPYAVSLDDSFANKTLCDAAENRRKGRRLPWEAYGADTERWKAMLHRVSQFKGDGAAKRKLAHFQRKTVDDDFLNRHLNDTRYASGLAKEYLERLYGRLQGGNHPAVIASSGSVTATLRRAWQLESVLGGHGKTRTDHRHHAIDALVLALTDAEQLERCRIIARTQGFRPGRQMQLESPWPGLRDELAHMLEQVVVSHRVSRKVQGRLHEDTFYGQRRASSDKVVTRVRKPLAMMTSSQVRQIADPVVRRVVLEALGDGVPSAVFAVDANLPRMPAANGVGPVIRAARITDTTKPFPVGSGYRMRQVANAENHHAVVWRQGESKWGWDVVSRFTAADPGRRGQPVVQRHFNDGREFIFSLVNGDCLQVNLDGRRQVVVVRSISDDGIECSLHADARMQKDRVKSGDRIRFRSARAVGAADPIKVAVSPIGIVVPQRD